MKKIAMVFIGTLLVVGLAGSAWATNGMNMIGTTAISSGMGGADVAVPQGCTAISTNPAQLAQTCNQVFSAGGSLLMPDMSMSLSGQPETDSKDQYFMLPFVGYAQRVGTSPWSLGLGVFAQGGMGVDFEQVQVMPGVSDHLYSNVGYARISPTVAYNVNEKLSIGASLFIGYATAAYEFFPNLPQGQNVTGLNSYTFSGRLGMSYQIDDQWAIGAMYTSESAIDFEHGTMDMNFGPGGTVRYNDVSMDDFTWPQQFDIGVSFRPQPALLLAMDISWINWSSAIDTVTVHAKNPNQQVPAGYEELTVPFYMNWKDQWVLALGGEYTLNDNWTVRAGYNYGQNPVPSENLNPLFPAIVEHHVTAGFTYSMGSWDFDFALEHAFENSQTNDGAPSATNPFSGTEVSHSQNSMHFMVSYRF